MRSFVTLMLLLALDVSARAETFVYVAIAAERKIAVYHLEPQNGKLTHRSDVMCMGEPGALVTDPARRFLFASLRAEGKLSAFRIDPRTGGLTVLNTVEAGPDPAHISTDAEGRFLLCAYYVAAKVTVHRIGDDGSLGTKPLQSLATADKAHAILLDRTNRLALVPHTGPNVIYLFAFDAAKGELAPTRSVKRTTPEMTGPRHLVYHPKLEIAYVDNEQGGSVTAYAIDAKQGTIAPLQTQSTLPDGYTGANACAEIRLHPSGKFLYVSNRGHDSIAGFRIAADGKLNALGQTATEKTPRSFDIDPTGQYLYAAGESSGTLASYRIDPTSGMLKPLAIERVGKMPWWVLAVEMPRR